jgi:hypothetical protein
MDPSLVHPLVVGLPGVCIYRLPFIYEGRIGIGIYRYTYP